MKTSTTKTRGANLGQAGKATNNRQQTGKQATGLAHEQQPTANSQQPTTNSQQPTANCQLPTANCQLPTANRQPPTANSHIQGRKNASGGVRAGCDYEQQSQRVERLQSLSRECVRGCSLDFVVSGKPVLVLRVRAAEHSSGPQTPLTHYPGRSEELINKSPELRLNLSRS